MIGVGCVVAGAGLVLVLDVVTGVGLDPVGVLWALLAMLCVATYFVLSAQQGNGLPRSCSPRQGWSWVPSRCCCSAWSDCWRCRGPPAPATYGGSQVPWWVAVLGLGVVTAAVAYTTGIAAGRRLGSRLASFVALNEVLFALAFAWLFLGEVPRAVQFAGGALILAGVVLVKVGEPRHP